MFENFSNNHAYISIHAASRDTLFLLVSTQLQYTRPLIVATCLKASPISTVIETFTEVVTFYAILLFELSYKKCSKKFHFESSNLYLEASLQLQQTDVSAVGKAMVVVVVVVVLTTSPGEYLSFWRYIFRVLRSSSKLHFQSIF